MITLPKIHFTKPAKTTTPSGKVLRAADTMIHFYLSSETSCLYLKVLGYGIYVRHKDFTPGPGNPHLFLRFSWLCKEFNFHFFKLMRFASEWDFPFLKKK